MLAGLLVGGAVQIVDADTVRTPARLLQQVEAHAISILEVVPSWFRVMLDELDTRGAERPELSALRWLLLTGEALPPHLCQEWFAQYPAIPLLNAYGPTECSDDVTHYPMSEPLPSDAPITPIGRAVANTQLYILDAQLQPTPIGVPGALYVGGVEVGRGYLHDAPQTAAAFIPDPFGPEPGACLYHTGDLVRYLPDGNIAFLGRLDFQVKIRGFRIELGEIETLLTRHPGVRESLVIAHETANGQPAARLRRADGRVFCESHGMAPAPESEAARLHGALGLCAARRVPAQPQRQSGPARLTETGARWLREQL